MKKGTRVGCPQVQDRFSGFLRPRTPDLGLSKQQQDVSRQKRSFLYPTSKHLSLLAVCWKWLSNNAHGRPERTLYCSQVESANRRVATCTPNSIFTLDKNTALREAELRRLEASLVAMHQAEQALPKEKRSEHCRPTQWQS